MFKNEPYEFEQIYRPLYEMHICTVWMICACCSCLINLFTTFGSNKLSIIQTLICTFMAAIFFMKGYKIFIMQKRLLGSKLEFIQLKDFIKKVDKNIKQDEFYLGQGFAWTPIQTQRCYELLKLDWSEISQFEPFFTKLKKRNLLIAKALKDKEHDSFVKKFKELKTVAFSPLPKKNDKGQKWIHGLSEKIEDISIPANWFNGHLLILGTTGSGKTRLADLLCTQCIMRGEALIIIDPKGDKEMLCNARNAAITYRNYVKETTGVDIGQNFFYFHPADPANSVRLNLLANSTRDTDIATRITNLIPSSTGGFDPFTAFGWLAINSIVQALLYIGKSPTINEIKLNLLDSMEALSSEAIDAFCKRADAQEIEANGVLSHNSYDDLVRKGMKLKKFMDSATLTTIKCSIFDEYYKSSLQYRAV